MQRTAFLTVLFLAALAAGGASAQTVTVPVPDAEETVSTVVGEVQTVVNEATGSSSGSSGSGSSGSGSSGSGSSGSGSSSGSSGSSGSEGSGSSSGGGAGTTAASTSGATHTCPPEQNAASSASGAGASSGGTGSDGSAMLASGRTGRSSAGRANRDAGGRETAAGGVLAERTFPDEAQRESAPATSVVVEDPQDLPLSVGLIALALTGVAFAGIVGGVTNHLFGSRARSAD